MHRNRSSNDRFQHSLHPMNILIKALTLASVASCLFSVAAQAQTTYDGNMATGFGGPVGDGTLALTNDGTTLTGTITPGANNGAGNNGELYDELVIYISTSPLDGGYANTSTFTDTGNSGGAGVDSDFLRSAVSGFDGSARSTVDFAPGFAADYAIAISPVGVGYSGLYQLSGGTSLVTDFHFLQSANISPTGTAAADYTFSVSLANLGSPGSFEFATTYLESVDGQGTLNRSNEAFNTLTDETTPANVGNPGTDEVLAGENLYVVPEPGTWAMLFAGAVFGIGFQRRRSRV
jgi:hypothetical protein